jgi:antitoxin YefM
VTAISATEARRRLYQLLDEVSDSHQPVEITGPRNSAVLVSNEDWRAVQETLHLVSIPGMRESIIEGMATPVEELEEKLDW